MDNIQIGLWVTGGMLGLVVVGMRVAFAAGLAGLIGLIWIFWARFGYDPERLGKA
ncbi:MAG: TRAP transporter large permease, partial [Pseudomonadota bacterium]